MYRAPHSPNSIMSNLVSATRGGHLIGVILVKTFNRGSHIIFSLLTLKLAEKN